MFCGNCGKKAIEGNLFCITCGQTQVVALAFAPVATPVQGVSIRPPEQSKVAKVVESAPPLALPANPSVLFARPLDVGAMEPLTVTRQNWLLQDKFLTALFAVFAGVLAVSLSTIALGIQMRGLLYILGVSVQVGLLRHQQKLWRQQEKEEKEQHHQSTSKVRRSGLIHNSG